MSKGKKRYIHPGQYKSRPNGISSANIGESAKKLYQIMFNLAKGEGICYAKVSTLSTKLHKSRSQVQRLLNQLVKAELLEAEMQQYGPVIYHFPKLDAARMRRRCGENAAGVRHIIKNTKSILYTKEDKELFNISFYKDTLKTLSHSSETRARLLFLLSKKEEEICPRTFLEGLIDGLGFSKDYVQEKIGTKDWEQLDEFRNKLITGYRLLDREKAGNFIQTLYPISHGRYIYYPYMMVELMEQGLCPGFDLSYLKAKTRMIKTLSKGLDASKMGGDLKEVHTLLGILTESYDYSDKDLREKSSSDRLTIN